MDPVLVSPPRVAFQGVVNGRSRALRRTLSTTLQLLESGVLLRAGENAGTIVVWSLSDGSDPVHLALRFAHGAAVQFTFPLETSAMEIGGWGHALRRVVGPPAEEREASSSAPSTARPSEREGRPLGRALRTDGLARQQGEHSVSPSSSSPDSSPMGARGEQGVRSPMRRPARPGGDDKDGVGERSPFALAAERAAAGAAGGGAVASDTDASDADASSRPRRAASGAWRALTSLAVVGIVSGAALLFWQGKLLEAEDDVVEGDEER